MYSLDIFICNHYLLYVRHSVLYIWFGEIHISYLVSYNMWVLSNTTYLTNDRLMLGHRLRRWPNINLTLCQCVFFGGKGVVYCRFSYVGYIILVQIWRHHMD